MDRECSPCHHPSLLSRVLTLCSPRVRLNSFTCVCTYYTVQSSGIYVPCEHAYTSDLVYNPCMYTSSYAGRDIRMSYPGTVVHNWAFVHNCLTIYVHCTVCPPHWIPLQKVH